MLLSMRDLPPPSRWTPNFWPELFEERTARRQLQETLFGEIKRARNELAILPPGEPIGATSPAMPGLPPRP
jgi:hypothetical protein